MPSIFIAVVGLFISLSATMFIKEKEVSFINHFAILSLAGAVSLVLLVFLDKSGEF